MSFPAFDVFTFYRNHQLLQPLGYQQWNTTLGWFSHNYVNKIKEQLESWGCQIRIGCEVYSVSSADGGCTVVSKDGSQEMYSGCIMAVHAPDALKMLGSQATFDEKRVLGAFQYANIDIFLHRDKKFMPQDRAVWSACNFAGNTDGKAYMTYWLNALQNIGETSLPFLVTLNPDHTPEHTGREESGFVALAKSSLIAAHGLLGKSYAISTNPRRCMEKQFFKNYIENSQSKFYWKFMIEADIGLADSYIDGDFSFEDKDEGLLKLIMSEDEDLKVAQMRKNSLLIEKARINEKHEVLELGCGWGTLAIETVKRTRCKYTGINIVEEQLKYEEMKVKEAGLQRNDRSYWP
ncbi:hypothetical protein ACOSQ4_014057 [Xanthoceras sorbifolium]